MLSTEITFVFVFIAAAFGTSCVIAGLREYAFSSKLYAYACVETAMCSRYVCIQIAYIVLTYLRSN